MKDQDFARLAETLRAQIDIPSIKGPVWFYSPIEHALRGICFEGSSFDRQSFYVWAFVQPACVPAEHLSLSLGKRILNGSADRWDFTEPALLPRLSAALRSQAIPILSRAESLGGAIDLATSWAPSKQPYLSQAVAYWLVLAGEYTQAQMKLKELHGLLDPKVSWQETIATRATELSRLLRVDRVQALQQLERWRTGTLENLKLEAFA